MTMPKCINVLVMLRFYQKSRTRQKGVQQATTFVTLLANEVSDSNI